MATDDAGGTTADAHPDTDGGPDAGADLPCALVAACEAACITESCRAQCMARGSTTGARLASALDTCVEASCPTMVGGVCETLSSNCQMCRGQALSNGCAVLYAACQGDGMPLLDGGGVEPSDGGTTRDGGGSTDSDGGGADGGGGITPGIGTCFDISLCANVCSTAACTARCLAVGTSQAQHDYSTLIECIYGACPRTNNGVCDYNAPQYDNNACGQCIGTAESAGHACFAPAVACTGTLCTRSTSCTTPADPYCDDSIGYCVQCRSSSDCPAGDGCIDYVCQPGNLACVNIYTCTFGCAGAACRDNCVAAGTASGRTYFNGYQTCQEAVCSSASGEVCDTRSSAYDQAACSQCIQRAQNGPCYAQILACIDNCSTNADCINTPIEPVCDRVSHTCVQCVRSSDCSSGSICASHVCIRTCDSDTDCPADQTCTDGICVARSCRVDADCPGGHRCEAATGQCLP